MIRKGESATKLATEFGVRKAIIRDWKKDHATIEQLCAETFADVKKLRNSNMSAFGKIDEALYLWFTE